MKMKCTTCASINCENHCRCSCHEDFKARPFPKKGTIPCKGCGYLLPEDSIAVQEWDGYCDDCMSNVPHNERDMMIGDDY